MDLETALRRNAELEAALAAANARIAVLEAQVKALLEQLGRNSGNSNRPPSSDPPAAREKRRTKPKSGRKRGGQPGHRGSTRALLPPEQVTEIADHFPDECESCWNPLPKMPDAAPTRSQRIELPPIQPLVIEDRWHTVRCACGYETAAPYLPPPTFGPRLEAVVALLTGVFHVSRRATRRFLSDVLDVEISLGSVSAVEARVSAAVKPAVEEAWDRAEQADVKHTDGTSWFQSGLMLSLWTIATSMVTVFKIIADGKKATLEKLLGHDRGRILVSDRATALSFWAMEWRQICWAHLTRRFVAFSERSGRAGQIGEELLDYVGVMFSYWDDVKTGQISRVQFRDQMMPVRDGIEAALRRAATSGIAGVAGSCANILEHEAALWTFVVRDDVEPTNNHAERELRGFVLWRRRSFGTQSKRGNEFAERLMTVVHTARKQNKNVLAFLTACCVARRDGGPAPSLFAA